MRAGGASLLLRLIAATVTGCASAIVFSTGNSAAAQSLPDACRSSYFLPKTLLAGEVIKAGSGTRGFVLRALTPKIVADNAQTFCLDFLRSHPPHTLPEFRKSSAGLLLHLGARAAQTETPGNIPTDILGGAQIARPSGPAHDDQANIVFRFEIDPFDIGQAAQLNDKLRAHGLCLVLEGYSFDPASTTAQYYCGNRVGFVRRSAGKRHAARDGAQPQPVPNAIVYRPRSPYKVGVYTQDRYRSRVPWRLLRAESIMFENASKPLALGIDAQLFATLKFELTFDNGALNGVGIQKPTETGGFVAIPLTVARSIVNIPNQTVMIKITSDPSSNSARLIEAQQELFRSRPTAPSKQPRRHIRSR